MCNCSTVIYHKGAARWYIHSRKHAEGNPVNKMLGIKARIFLTDWWSLAHLFLIEVKRHSCGLLQRSTEHSGELG